MQPFNVGFSSLPRLSTETSTPNNHAAPDRPLDEGAHVSLQRGVRHTHGRHSHSRHVAAPLVAVPGTQQDADKVVAAKYIAGLESARWNDWPSYQKTMLADVPSNSSIGVWWQQYRDALNNPNFVQWSKEVGLNVATMRLNPDTGTLVGEFNGEKKQVLLRADVGWTEVADPILSAARVLAPPRRGTPISLGSPDAGVPLEVVGNFYAENNADPATWRAQERAAELKKLGAFPDIPAHDSGRSPTVRGPQALADQQQVLAEIDDDYSVMVGQPDKSAQAKADRLLGARFAAELRQGPWDGDALYQKTMSEIPKGSTFGQWWQLYRDAFKTPQFLNWVKANGVDVSTVQVSPLHNDVYATFNGTPQARNFDHNKEWAQALAPIQSATAAVAATRHNKAPSPVDFPDNAAPLKLVAAFCGHNLVGFDEHDAGQTADEIESNPASFISQDRGGILSMDALQAQQLALGKLHDKHALTQSLADVEKVFTNGSSDNFSRLLKDSILRVHPDSPYGQHHSAHPGHTVSVSDFIQGSGLSVPHNREQLSNLRKVLNSAPLQAPAQGNYWRLLTPPMLSSEQRRQVSAVSAESLGVHGIPRRGGIARLFGSTVKSLAGEGAAKTLERLLSSTQAKALSEVLEKKLGGKSTATSAADWAAAAMVLNLDPAAGTQRNRVAGYDLAQESNWGLTPQAIVDGLTHHLTTQGKVREPLAPAAGRLLLAGMAPEFLVAEMPSTLVYGSHAWCSFSMAVARIEKMAPGASQGMTFREVMAFGDTQPISLSEQDMQVGAQRDAIVDWGIINGFIAKRADGVYSNESIELARSRFNQQRTELASASDAQQAAIPSHKALALAQLRKVLGNDIDFEKMSIRSDQAGKPFDFSKRPSYSIVELYMSGILHESKFKWACDDSKVPFQRVLQAAQSLPDLKRLYQAQADGYSVRLKSSVALNIRNLLADLPLEDRKNFQSGNPEIYAVRGGDSGLVIRTRRTSPPTDYELFPSQKLLRKHTGLPDPLTVGTHGSLALDFPAYQKGAKPQEGKTSKNVIIERIPFSGVTGSGSISADEPSNSDSIPRSFFTQNTKNLANAAAGYFVSGFEALKEKSKGTTAHVDKVQSDTGIKDTLVRMIPFVAAAEDAKAGHYGAAAVDLAFDVFGFLAPELKLVEAGASALSKLGSREVESLVSSRVGNALEGEVASSVKLGDGAGELSSAGHGLNRQHILSPSALSDLVRRGDVAVGSVKGEVGSVAVLAQYDEAAQKWYAYDARAGKPYGPPLSGFTPEASALPVSTPGVAPAVPSFLEQGLEQDNVIQMGGKMEDLQLIGTEIHTFTDTYKGHKRLNIVAHGTNRNWLDKLLLEGSEVMVDGKPYDAKKLVALLKSKGVDPSSFDNVRLLVCHLAEGRGFSFASRFQKIIKRPVKAFEGTVTLRNGSDAVTRSRLELTKDLSAQYPNLPGASVQQLADAQVRRDFVTKLATVVQKKHGSKIWVNSSGVGGAPNAELKIINYRKAHFGYPKAKNPAS